MKGQTLLAAFVALSSSLPAGVHAHGPAARPAGGWTRQPARATSPSLPGASGPRVELVGTPPDGIQIVDAFIYEKPEQAGYGVARPRRFSSNAPRLNLDVRLKDLPPLGTEIRFEVVTDRGPLEMAEGLVSMARLASQGVASLDFDLRPKNGPFADGPYQLKLFMDDVPVAILNWSVGGR